jgi:hypothetical protein
MVNNIKYKSSVVNSVSDPHIKTCTDATKKLVIHKVHNKMVGIYTIM